jgi:uncharacterized repeat protein (TIGR01451 family)
VYAGDWFKYELSVTNNGPGDAYDVRVEDDLPAGLNYVKHRAVAEIVQVAGQSLIWEVGYLAQGASKSIEIHVEVDEDTPPATNGAGEFCNEATVTIEDASQDLVDPLLA